MPLLFGVLSIARKQSISAEYISFLEFSPGRLKNNFARGHILIDWYNNPILYPVYFTTYFSVIQHNITYLCSYVTFIVFNLAYGFNR